MVNDETKKGRKERQGASALQNMGVQCDYQTLNPKEKQKDIDIEPNYETR